MIVKFTNSRGWGFFIVSAILIAALVFYYSHVANFMGGVLTSDENWSSLVQCYRIMISNSSDFLAKAWIVCPFIYFWIYKIFGIDVYSTRLVIATISLFGALSFCLGLRRIYGALWALVCLILIITSVHFLHFSSLAIEHGISFGFLGMLFYLTIGFFVRNASQGLLYKFLFALTFVFGAWTYPGMRLYLVSSFLGAGLVLMLLCRKQSLQLFRKGWKNLVYVSFIFLFYPFVFFVLFGKKSLSYYGGGYLISSFSDYFSGFLILLRELFWKTESWDLPYKTSFYPLFFLLLFAVGSAAAFRRKQKNILWLSLTTIISFFLIPLASDYPGLRRWTMAIFGFLGVVTYGIMVLFENWKYIRGKMYRWTSLAAFLILICTSILAPLFKFREISKANYGTGIGTPLDLNQWFSILKKGPVHFVKSPTTGFSDVFYMAKLEIMRATKRDTDFTKFNIYFPEPREFPSKLTGSEPKFLALKSEETEDFLPADFKFLDARNGYRVCSK